MPVAAQELAAWGAAYDLDQFRVVMAGRPTIGAAFGIAADVLIHGESSRSKPLRLAPIISGIATRRKRQARLARDRDGLDLDLEAVMQLRNGNNAARRPRIAGPFGIELVEGRPVGD